MTDSTERNAAGHSAEPADSADLATAVIRLVPAINDAVTAHRAGSCRWCTPTTRGGCPRHAWQAATGTELYGFAGTRTAAWSVLSAAVSMARPR